MWCTWSDSRGISAVCVYVRSKNMRLNQPTSRNRVCAIWRMLHFLRIVIHRFGAARGVFCFCRYCCYSRRRFRFRLFFLFCFIRRNNEPNGIKKYFSLWIRLHCRLHAVDIVIIIDSKQHTKMYSSTHTHAPIFILIDAVFRTQNFPLLQQCRHFIELCTNIMLFVWVPVPRKRLTPPQSRSLARTHTQPNYHICQFKYNVFSHRQNWLMLIKSI